MPRTLDYPTMNLNRANVHRMITMHTRPRQTDRRTIIMAIARRFVLTNASRARNNEVYFSHTQMLQRTIIKGQRCQLIILCHPVASVATSGEKSRN